MGAPPWSPIFIMNQPDKSIVERGQHYTIIDQSLSDGHDNTIMMMLFGSYHDDQREFARNERPLYQWLRKARKNNQKFVLAKPQEPNMLWSLRHALYPREERFIFDVIHDHMANTGFDANNFRFVSGNPHVSQCYAGYCDWKQIPPQSQIHTVSRAFWLKFFDESRLDHPQMCDKKTHMFQLLNRSYRVHKGDLLLKMVDAGLLEEHYAQKYHKSFSFYNQAQHFEQQNPGIENYYCTLEQETADTFDLEKAVLEVNNTDTMAWALQSSLFDVVVDYCQLEDLGELNFSNYIKTFPWWVEDIISEKTYRNFYYKKPFIRFGEPGGLHVLREQYGFKTFDGVLFDESYDQMTDYHERMQAIVDQIKHILDNYTVEQFQQKILSDPVQEILEHNHRQYHTVLKYLENSTGIFSWIEHGFLNNNIQN